MSIIQTIRDKGTWLIFILLGLALISFIFMDAGKKGDLFGGGNNNPTLGSVNGSNIKSKEYYDRVSALTTAYEKKTEITKDQIENYVWNSMLDEKLLASELGKLDIGLDDKTLGEIGIGKYGQPNQHLAQFFKTITNDQIADPQNPARINIQQAELIIKQLKGAVKSNADDTRKYALAYQNLLPLVKYEYLLGKYNMLLSTTNYAPKWLANKRNNDNNAMANISMVQVPYVELNDSTIAELKPTDEDIKNFISKNPDRYKVNETRSIDYVTFDFKPTAEDSANQKAELEIKKAKLQATSDSLAGIYVMNNNSLMPYSDLYVRKSALQIADSSASLTDGNTIGPYVNNGNYVVAKILKVKNYPDTANVRHILIKTMDPQKGEMVRTDSAALVLLDSVMALYKAGQSFDSLAKRFSEDDGSKDKGGLYENLTIATNFIPEFLDYALTHAAGTTDTLKTIFGYHFMRAEGTKGSVKPAYKVAYLAKSIVPSQNTRDSVEGIATAFAASVRTGKDFDDYFLKNPTVLKQNGYNINRNNLTIPGIRSDAKEICKWAFGAKLNEVSKFYALDDDNKFVIAKLQGAQDEGALTPDMVRKDMKNQMILEQIKTDKKYNYIAKKYGTPATLEEAATKTGKQIMVKDSISFQSGTIPDISPEGRVVGAAFNKAYLTKVSGPIKGTTGVYYIKVNSQPYTIAAPNTDMKQTVKAIEQEFMQLSQQATNAFRKNAKIKDKRLEAGN
jgi:peptidyl-prolyl cis-trans isomerase D